MTDRNTCGTIFLVDINRYGITIFKRNDSYYARFYDKVLRRDVATKSINILASELGYNVHRKISEQNARIIAIKALDNGIVGLPSSNISFAKYLTDFWDWENSSYIKEKNGVSPNSIGRDHAENMLTCIEKHVIPTLPKGIKLSQVTPMILKDTLLSYLQGEGKDLAAATKNKIISSIRKPCEEALKNNLIVNDPTVLLPRFSDAKKKKPGILTDEEVKTLLSTLSERMEKELEESEKPTNLRSTRQFLLVSMAFLTGERPGEIRALSTDSIEFIEDSAIIHVREAISRGGERKLPKNNKERENAVPTKLALMLTKLASFSPIPENTIVFWSDIKPNQPIGASHARDLFYEALESIGIGKEERNERNLILYGARHYFNNTMRFILSGEELRDWMGHRDIRMTENYSQNNKKSTLIIKDKVKENISSIFEENS